MRRNNSTLKALLSAALLSLPCLLSAQYRWDAGFTTGASNYLGDIGGNALTRRDFVADMKLSQTHPDAGVFVRYRVMREISVQGNLSWARISGDDKLSSNPARNARNLNFRNDIFELAAQGQFFFYEVNDIGHTYRYRNNFRTYVGLGIGAIYHNPKALYNGDWVPLRPLETEGNHYTSITAVIPASAGFYFTVNKHYRIGWNLTWRTTFTDYLDDVSTRYADPSTMTPLGAALANRTDELPNVNSAFAENFTPGNKRGDSSHNDSYLTSNVDFSYVIRGSSKMPGARYAWIHDRPDKVNGSGHRTHILVRTKRYRW